MAPAVRVTLPAIAGLGVGAFGSRVVDLLGPQPARDVDSVFRSDADVVVVALWRPAPALCERADRLAFEHGTRWLPVVLEHPVVRIGPLVTPPAAPCYACYQARRAQHDERRDTTAMLYDAYDRDPGCGPTGFLPHHARTAAAIARRLAAEDGDPGRVVTVRPAGSMVSADRVVPLHGCERCGSPYRERDLRDLFGLRRTAGAR